MAGPIPDLDFLVGNMADQTSGLVGNDGLIPDLDYKASVMGLAGGLYGLAQTSMGNPSRSTVTNSVFGPGTAREGAGGSYKATSERIAERRAEAAKAAETAAASSGVPNSGATPFSGFYVHSS